MLKVKLKAINNLGIKIQQSGIILIGEASEDGQTNVVFVFNNLIHEYNTNF